MKTSERVLVLSAIERQTKEKYMRAIVFHGPFDVRVEQVRDATLQEPTDALVRITHAAICGSDLWPY
jgi:D-arabinose 1-dehydrogenase-like Zn-dependent alcohol dehydrogenase